MVKQLLLDKERTPSTTLAIQHMNNFSEFVKVSLLSTTLLLILDSCFEVLANEGINTRETTPTITHSTYPSVLPTVPSTDVALLPRRLNR